MTDNRKVLEKQFHNTQRTIVDDIHVADMRWSPELETTIRNNPLWANMKYYAVERSSRSAVLEWLRTNCKGKTVLDYCCGNGEDGIFLAKNGAAYVMGIDISDISINNSKKKANKEGLKNLSYKVMDAEALSFDNETFDIISEYGALHHLDLTKAYLEMARALKPDGKVICVETLGHNPIIRLYRKITPHLRTSWEVKHILKKKDIELAKNYFRHVEILGFFHLATIMAVPFRNTGWFDRLLSVLEKFDGVLLKIPYLKWQAWQIVFVLSDPIKKLS